MQSGFRFFVIGTILGIFIAISHYKSTSGSVIVVGTILGAIGGGIFYFVFLVIKHIANDFTARMAPILGITASLLSIYRGLNPPPVKEESVQNLPEKKIYSAVCIRNSSNNTISYYIKSSDFNPTLFTINKNDFQVIYWQNNIENNNVISKIIYNDNLNNTSSFKEYILKVSSTSDEPGSYKCSDLPRYQFQQAYDKIYIRQID